MDLDGRRSSYSINRVLEEVQEQKTKEEQLRQSWLGDQLPPASPEVSQSSAEPNAQEELAFKPGFVNQLLGKFGGSTASSGGRLRKAASAQNLAAPAPNPTVTPSGVLLRHPNKISSVGGGSGGGSGGNISGVRRRSQDGIANGHVLLSPSNTSSPSASLASSASTPTFSSSATSKVPSSSTTTVDGGSGGGGGRVFIIPKASTPPVVKRLQQQSQQQRLQQQQQQQQSEQPQKPALSPSTAVESSAETATKSFVPIPSDESLPIKNMVQAKRSLFEQTQLASNRSKTESNGSDGSLSTVAKAISPKPAQQQYVRRGGHQPVIGRASPSAGNTRQIVPRPTVEIRSAARPTVPTSKPLPSSPLKPPSPASPSPAKASTAAILPSRPIVTSTVAPSKKTSAPEQPSNIGSSSDGYGFGLPVPQLKTSLPFNGEVTKKVELSERAVTAMRKAGKSWFFGTDVAAAPEGTIAVKLTPNDRPFSLTDEDEVSGGYVDDGLTEERRAQTTVWDHVRNADSGQQRVDPGLAAEARRLMASANTSGGEDADAGSAPMPAHRGIATGAAAVAARNRNRKLCFKRDSVLEETFEYQSEQSLIDELQITPDYPTGPFELSDEPGQDEEAEEEAATTDRSSGKQAASVPAAGGATAMATYRTKSADEFVWGATRPSSAVKETASSPTAKDSNGGDEGDTTDAAGAVDDPDAQWSASATTDLLF